MSKRKELSLEKELEAARKLVLSADSQTRVSIVINEKPVNHYKDMAFVCWLDYLILFTKAKKKFPSMVADEFHKVRLNKERKFEMMQALFKHFLETNEIDGEIRQCLYTLIDGTNSLGGRSLFLSNKAAYERYLDNHAVKIDIKNNKASQDVTVLFFYYLFEFIKAKDNKTKKAEIISFLTPFDAESTRQKFYNLHEKTGKVFEDIAKDMLTARKLFEMLDLTETLTMIDNDFEDIKKEMEEKL